jgi:Lrp/AsnC family transcriptional regulator for asnA, asnC and gidA
MVNPLRGTNGCNGCPYDIHPSNGWENLECRNRQGAAVIEGTVRRRLKRLMDEGFIKIVALVDPRPMGYKSEALIGIQAEPQMIDEVAEAIAELNEVSWLVVTTGGYDIFAWVAVASSEELGSFLSRKIGPIAGVSRSEAFMNLAIKKTIRDISAF